jgi:hypothetical protein
MWWGAIKQMQGAKASCRALMWWRTEAVATLRVVYEREVEEMRVVSSSTPRERNG